MGLMRRLYEFQSVRKILKAAEVSTNVRSEVGRAIKLPDRLVYRLCPCDI